MKHTLLSTPLGRLFLPLLVLLAIIAPLRAAPPAQSLTAALDHLLADPALRGGVTGAIVVRVSDGRTLYEHDADLRLLPASNRKLFTAAAALGILGDEFVYKTQVLARTKPDAQGVLHGDITLVGVGDGALTTIDMDDMAKQVAAADVKLVKGTVLADNHLFTDGPYGFGWEWDDLSDEEFSVISSLTVNDGDVLLQVLPGAAVIHPAGVGRDPLAHYPPVVGTAHTVAAGTPNTVAVIHPLGKDNLQLSGDIPMGAVWEQHVPVPNPALYAASVLDYSLHLYSDGTNGPQPAPPAAVPPAVVLATHTSLPMAQYLPLMMKPSDNLIAECLVRTIGAIKGKGGTYEAGHVVETPFFQSLGVDTTALDLRDGSGVSRRNFVTARAVGQLLVGMSKRPDFRAYYDALPIAGVDGTLKSRMAGTRAAGNVHAKTGTLSQARALSGYVTGPRGGLYAFSLIMNNFPGNARSAGDVQDKFVEYLADTLPAGVH